MYEHIAIISLVIAGLTLIFTTLSTFFSYLQIRNHIPIQNLLLKIKKYDRKIMFVTIILLAGVLIWQLFSNKNTPPDPEIPGTETIGVTIQNKKDTLLVFAGGGSVRNYLMQSPRFRDKKTGKGIDVRSYPHSINIAIASGSAWRVLAEEYQFRHIKDSDSLNMFTAICLSAGEMSNDFYSEYMSDMPDAIVAKVSLGDDELVTYISKGLSDYWGVTGKNLIPLDILVQKLQNLIKSNQEIEVKNNGSIETRKVSIFTTNKTSGTLEAYKKCFHDAIDFEAMITNKQAYVFYDNMFAKTVRTQKANDGEFIIFGSEYYYVEGMDKNPLHLRDRGKPITKPMCLYFLAHHKKGNEFEIHKSILKFLDTINDGLTKNDPIKWNKVLKDGIIEYDISAPTMDIIQLN